MMLGFSPAHQRIENAALRAKHGDVKAFEFLYDELIRDVYRFVYSRVSNKFDADDITAEVWKTVWQKLPTYKPKNFKGYLFRIAYTTCMDFFRKNKKTQQQQSDLFEFIPDTAKNQIEKMEENDSQKTVRTAISKLAPHYKEVILLRFVEEFSVQETAHILEKSSISVRVLQFRALHELRKILKNI